MKAIKVIRQKRMGSIFSPPAIGNVRAAESRKQERAYRSFGAVHAAMPDTRILLSQIVTLD
jgi:hypothetical protein